MGRSLARVFRRRADGHSWEMAYRSPPESVTRYVRQYCGYRERTPAPLRRLEFPVPQAVAIFEFGPPIRLVDPADESRAERFAGGFVAGLGDTFAITEHDGFQQGMEVKLTPIGARLLFDVPMSELANRAVDMDDLLDPPERGISHRLGELTDWDARFDLLDDFIAGRIARARTPTDLAAWAMARIEETGGRLDIRALAREAGYSQKHLISLFHDQVGLPPKLVARLVRFERVMDHVKTRGPGRWADVAARYGYYDQAHLIRDVRQFTGTTPTGAGHLVAELAAMPGAGT